MTTTSVYGSGSFEQVITGIDEPSRWWKDRSKPLTLMAFHSSALDSAEIWVEDGAHITLPASKRAVSTRTGAWGWQFKVDELVGPKWGFLRIHYIVRPVNGFERYGYLDLCVNTYGQYTHPTICVDPRHPNAFDPSSDATTTVDQGSASKPYISINNAFRFNRAKVGAIHRLMTTGDYDESVGFNGLNYLNQNVIPVIIQADPGVLATICRRPPKDGGWNLSAAQTHFIGNGPDASTGIVINTRYMTQVGGGNGGNVLFDSLLIVDDSRDGYGPCMNGPKYDPYYGAYCRMGFGYSSRGGQDNVFNKDVFANNINFSTVDCRVVSWAWTSDRVRRNSNVSGSGDLGRVNSNSVRCQNRQRFQNATPFLARFHQAPALKIATATFGTGGVSVVIGGASQTINAGGGGYIKLTFENINGQKPDLYAYAGAGNLLWFFREGSPLNNVPSDTDPGYGGLNLLGSDDDGASYVQSATMLSGLVGELTLQGGYDHPDPLQVTAAAFNTAAAVPQPTADNMILFSDANVGPRMSTLYINSNGNGYSPVLSGAVLTIQADPDGAYRTYRSGVQTHVPWLNLGMFVIPMDPAYQSVARPNSASIRTIVGDGSGKLTRPITDQSGNPASYTGAFLVASCAMNIAMVNYLLDQQLNGSLSKGNWANGQRHYVCQNFSALRCFSEFFTAGYKNGVLQGVTGLYESVYFKDSLFASASLDNGGPSLPGLFFINCAHQATTSPTGIASVPAATIATWDTYAFGDKSPVPANLSVACSADCPPVDCYGQPRAIGFSPVGAVAA